ncbi:MAG: porin [Hylemonella sp.]|uniref:porin n=1 Tax=Hylemonella sp. TaxID=2066020 RepID=UPI0022BD1264|nr:porin [Hylemonella sp.]MCZ8253607.1 porin [Hylemonella sp.]
MKKTLIAVAALAATGAFAQVSVYGRLDAGWAQTKTTTNGVSTKANGVESHNSASSMWGIQGSEDLGGGLKATFKLEQDIYTANGNTGASGAGGGATNAAGFNRTSLLGLTGGFGSVAFGRDYVPTFKLAAATDINSQSRITTVNTAAVVGSTRPELIHYSTPNLSGFQANLAYGNQDESVSNATGKTNVKVTNLTATYMNGPLMVGVGTGRVEQKAAGAAATTGTAFVAFTAADKVTQNMVAGSYDFGVVRLVGNVIMGKATNAGTALGSFAELKSREINIGGVVPMGKVTLRAQIGTNQVEVTGASEKWDGNDFVVGAEYALSAKTAAFFKTGTYGKGSGINAALDTKSTSTAVGLRTVF